MQVLDSLIDGPLELGNVREGNELIGMIVRYLRTGDDPAPRTDSQKMALAMVRPVLEKSRSRIVAGSKGGSEQQSKTTSKPPSKKDSKPPSKQVSDIYSSSLSPLPDSSSDEGVQGEGDGIPYGEIVRHLNEAVGASYRPGSKKTRQLIRARWEEGFRLPDFISVIDTMEDAWGDDPKMIAYLRPETLFGTKFEGYLNRPKTRKGGGDFEKYAD